MSTRKGESVRKRPQKYQNTRAYKNDLHDRTPMTLALNNLNIACVCEKCKRVLEWRIKFKKFKPRKAPGTCTKCQDKTVKHAYHIMCKPCAGKLGVCPKCGKKEEVVEPELTTAEQIKLDHEMDVMLKSLSERKRRTFLRYLEKSRGGRRKRKDSSEEGGSSQKSSSKDEGGGEAENAQKGTKDLLAFLERLKISQKGDKFDDFDLDDFGDSDSEDFDKDGGDEDDDDDDDEDDDDDDDDEGDDEGDEDVKSVKKEKK